MSAVFQNPAQEHAVLIHLIVRPRLADDAPIILDPAPLIQELLKFIEIARHLFATQLSPSSITKLICDSFAVLMEGSVRDNKFWNVTKDIAQLDQLVSTLLLGDSRQTIRKGIAEHIAIVGGLSKPLKKQSKLGSEDVQESTSPDNPTSIDILATIWDAFVRTFPQTPNHASQSQEFFDIALSVFRSVAEKSPRDLIFGDYLRQWSTVMLSHQTEEVCFVSIDDFFTFC